MEISVIHQIHPYTTGNYFRKSWMCNHDLLYLSQLCPWPLQISNFLKDNNIDLLVAIDPIGVRFPSDLDKSPCPTAIYLIDVHQNLEHRLKLAHCFDYVFVAQKDYLPVFIDAGIKNVFWLPLACDPTFHLSPEATEAKHYEIGFVGNFGAGDGQRQKILNIMSQRFKMNDLRRSYRPEEIGLIYSRSELVFNWSINGDVNMRIFEALCSGRLLLTNMVPNGLEELFTDKKHLVIYHSINELIELAQYYLDHPVEREAIARNGQQEVLANHTYQHRAEQILSTIFGDGIFKARNPQLTASIRSWTPQKRWEACAEILADLRQPLATWSVAKQAFGQGEATWKLGNQIFIAGLRAINARVPITPNALRHRLRTFPAYSWFR
jgi:hypothetical protein